MNRFTGICFLILVGLASSAMGDSVKLNFHDVNNGGGAIDVEYSSVDFPAGVYTGPYTFEVKDSSEYDLWGTYEKDETKYIDLFCFELQQAVSSNDVTYTDISLSRCRGTDMQEEDNTP